MLHTRNITTEMITCGILDKNVSFEPCPWNQFEQTLRLNVAGCLQCLPHVWTKSWWKLKNNLFALSGIWWGTRIHLPKTWRFIWSGIIVFSEIWAIKPSHRLQVNSYIRIWIFQNVRHKSHANRFIFCVYCSNMPQLRAWRTIYIFFKLFHLIYFHTTYSIIIKLCVSKCTRFMPSYDSFGSDQGLFRREILTVSGSVSKGGLSAEKNERIGRQTIPF